MSADFPNELQQFCDFIALRAENGAGSRSLDDAVRQFREYQKLLSGLCNEIAVADQQSAADGSAPFDAETTNAANDG